MCECVTDTQCQIGFVDCIGYINECMSAWVRACAHEHKYEHANIWAQSFARRSLVVYTTTWTNAFEFFWNQWGDKAI